MTRETVPGAAASGASPGTTEPEPGVLRRAIGASAIGNATEWFDYGLYAYGVTWISAALFPGNVEEATLFALATFAISFIVRPLGGLVWGPLGDRLGRKTVLSITIIMMCTATVLVGVLPTYDAVGWWSTGALIVLRIIQGFSTGGEYGGAATFMAEYAPDRRRGFLGSFLEFGTLAGFVLAAGLMLILSLVLPEESMQAWGWRLPFFVAAPLGLVGFYLRNKMEDTPVFRELEEKGAQEHETKTQFKDLVSGYWRPLLKLSGLVLVLNFVNYTLLSYTPTYLETEAGMSASDSLLVPVIGMVAMMVVLPFVGRISDRVGRKPVWWVSIIGLFVLAIPMYMLMGTGLVGGLIGFAVLGLLYVPQLATISSTFPAMFPTHVRFAGFAIAYNVSTSLFGGPALAANDAVINATGSVLVPAFGMMIACAIGAVALVTTVETAGCSLRGREVPGVEEISPVVVERRQGVGV